MHTWLQVLTRGGGCFKLLTHSSSNQSHRTCYHRRMVWKVSQQPIQPLLNTIDLWKGNEPIRFVPNYFEHIVQYPKQSMTSVFAIIKLPWREYCKLSPTCMQWLIDKTLIESWCKHCSCKARGGDPVGQAWAWSINLCKWAKFIA